MAKRGRPSEYSQSIADEICRLLACGTPLVKICDRSDMPAYSTVRKWENENPQFSALSARGKADGTHFLADESLNIADEPLSDDAEKARIEVQHRKLRIDTRMRLIGKWNAKEYGDKSLIGSDPDNPLPAGFNVNLRKANGE